MTGYWFTPAALADAAAIQDYIGKDRPGAALAWVEKLETTCQQLVKNPGTGRPREELRPNLRSLPLGKYVIFYRQTNRGVEIVRVLHSARDIRSLFPGNTPAPQ